MISVRIVDRPSFTIAGKQTWISGPDNEQFGQFWQQCKAEKLLDRLHQLKPPGQFAGPQTGGVLLGVSRVEKDPANRAFHYMISVEVPEGMDTGDLDRYTVPAARWAVFECRGPMPDGLVASEMYAFGEWLPNSGCQHALAPEMEVYLPAVDENGDGLCEFWLPVVD